MASFCRSAAAAARSAALRSKSRIASPFPATRSPVAAAPRLRRSAVKMLAGAESLMPLHSAVAGARLRSCIAADSSCWSYLSQGLIKRI
ncbi:protein NONRESPONDING TO OXYLIPINS 2, mitochondrial-like isoform X2 [Hordeum vulgare subsp. vulgare]|uniref:protein NONRESPONDING TO OXYLIPINS 2, mitochondrial-like isoform X2 n=1 Tax=Hordeum vulgare subsp. vulgare TaxID=112509 RepID=UPI000295DAAA|nr:protein NONRESPONDING TO OXYLIPINS 2, mitochondrial-like isoform X2 [Hordeum vulgare subsp. vulgare]